MGVGRQHPGRRRRDDDHLGALAEAGVGDGVLFAPQRGLDRLGRQGAENVVAPTNRWAPSVITGATWAPASTSRRQTSTAL